MLLSSDRYVLVAASLPPSLYACRCFLWLCGFLRGRDTNKASTHRGLGRGWEARLPRDATLQRSLCVILDQLNVGFRAAQDAGNLGR